MALTRVVEFSSVDALHVSRPQVGNKTNISVVTYLSLLDCSLFLGKFRNTANIVGKEATTSDDTDYKESKQSNKSVFCNTPAQTFIQRRTKTVKTRCA